MGIEIGATRVVFIFESFVIKLPTYLSWKLFLHGLLANLQERQFSGSHPDLARVIYCNPLGIFLVMKKAETCHYESLFLLELLTDKYKDEPLRDFLLSDFKVSNWGIFQGNLVKVDYGN